MKETNDIDPHRKKAQQIIGLYISEHNISSRDQYLAYKIMMGFSDDELGVVSQKVVRDLASLLSTYAESYPVSDLTRMIDNNIELENNVAHCFLVINTLQTSEHERELIRKIIQDVRTGILTIEVEARHERYIIEIAKKQFSQTPKIESQSRELALKILSVIAKFENEEVSVLFDSDE